MDIITAALAASMSGGGGGGTGTDDYNELSNKPKINGVTLAGSKSLEDIGAAAAAETYTETEVDALLAGKVDKVDGKGLSTEDFTAAEKSKLAGIAAGAEVNVQSNWAQTSSSADDFIKNKPTLGAAAAKGVDSAPTASSTNLVESGGVYAALATKLNTADVDAALSSTSTNPVQNKAVQAPIARLVDAEAKNLLNLVTPSTINRMGITDDGNGSVTASCNNVTWANSGYELSLTAGKTYKFIIYVDSASVSNVQFQCFVGDISGSEAQELGRTSRITSPGVYSVDFVATTKIRVGINLNNSATAASGSATYHAMLCTAEDYAISPEFVPYAPSNRELYEMILALQNAQNGG